MKKTRLLAGLFALTAFALIGCKKEPKEEPQDPVDPIVEHVCEHKCPDCGKCTDANCTDPVCADKCTFIGQTTTIKAALEGEANKTVKVEGVVYAKTSTGFFVADATENIYVEGNKQVAVGDKVALDGTFTFKTNKPYIKDVKHFNKVAEGQTVATPVDATIAEIAAYDATAKTGVYGKYVKLTGTLRQHAALGTVGLADEDKNFVFFDKTSLNDDLRGKIGSRIDVCGVVSEKTSTGWTLVFDGKAIVDHPYTFEEYTAIAKAHIDEEISTEAFGRYKVVSQHDIFPEITYTWASNNDALKIEYVDDPATTDVVEEVLTITVDYNVAQDTDVTLTATIHVGDQTATYDKVVTVKKIEEQSVKHLIENIPVIDMSAVIVKGIAAGYSNNQSHSLYGIILEDPEDPTFSTQVDVSKEQFESVSIGDEVRVFGFYRSLLSGDRPTIMGDPDLLDFVVTPQTTVQVTYTPYFVVDSEEDMVELATHWMDKYCGRFVQFKGAYAVWNCSQSGKNTKSYLVISMSKDKYQYPIGADPKDTSIVLLYGNNTDYLGTSYWADNMGVNYTGEEQVIYQADFIAVPSYFTSGTIAMLSIPSIECWKAINPEDAINANLDAEVVRETQTTDVALPTKITVGEVDYAITWTSNKPTVIANDGKVTPVDQTTNVVLTATYTIADQTKTFEVEVTVLGVHYDTVAELLANEENGAIVMVQGVVVGYQQTASYSAAGAKRTGYVLMDDTTGEMIYTNGAQVIGGSIYAGFKDSLGNDIKVGDRVKIKSTYFKNTANPGSKPSGFVDEACQGRCYLDLETSGSTVEVVEHNQTVALDKAIVVDSDEDLEALLAGGAGGLPYNKLIKITATEENPFYLYNNSGTWKMPAADGEVSTGNNISIAWGSANKAFTYQYNDVLSCSLKFSICSQGSQFVWQNAGKEGTWYSQAGWEGSEASKTTKQAYGTIYVNFSYVNSSYYHLTMVCPNEFSFSAYQVVTE